MEGEGEWEVKRDGGDTVKGRGRQSHVSNVLNMKVGKCY